MDQLQKIDTPLSEVPQIKTIIEKGTEQVVPESANIPSELPTMESDIEIQEKLQTQPSPPYQTSSWRSRFGKQLKYFDKDMLLGILSVCIIILSTFFTPKAPYFTLKSHRHNLVGVIALAIVLAIAYKFNPMIAIGFAIVYAVAMILHKMWRKRHHKVYVTVSEPEKATGPIHTGAEVQVDEVPQIYTPDEPIMGVSESDMQSLCAHLHQKDKNATDEIVTSADFSELVNTEHACNFAKHQYENLPPISRASKGIAEGVME